MKKPLILLTSSILLTLLISCSCDGNKMAHRIYLADSWKVQQSSKISEDGAALSSATVDVSDWYAAQVPSTVMGTLVNNGLYPDIMTGTHLKNIDKTPFDVSWWYRTEFSLPEAKNGQHVYLHLDGISYYANIWLNGELVASHDRVFGPFRQFKFDITGLAQKDNVLAVEIFRAQPGDPNIGFVDWNPRPADENMGIFREVYVCVSGEVGMNHPHVASKVNTETLQEAWLTVETELVNYSDKAVKGKLTGKMENIKFSIPVSLQPKESKIIKLTPEDVPALHVTNPRIWWCNNLGSPELYDLDLKFITGQTVSAQQTVTFGIREIKDYFTEENHRGFMLNGKKVLIKSAGWTDDLFLRDTPESNEIQVKYVKDMNLNSIRFENFWGNSQNIYDLCDRYGLMMLVGWSCQWEWEEYLGKEVDSKYGGIISPEDIELIAQSFEDQVLWLRNHPSIIAWGVGSDMFPHPDLEKKYLEILPRIDNRPYVSSTAWVKSELTGFSGMKMNGPYEYVGPGYWYEDRKFGGAYGFNSETGIGAQLPVYESILKMIPQDKLWPLNDMWNYHCTTAESDMHDLRVLTQVMDNKYGKAKHLEDYLLKAHVIDYEGTKAMFEAFRVNIPEATGIVQWMLNSAWPSLYWQIYDYYLIPTAGYYGVKRGNVLQQLIYNYKEHAVYAVNEDVNSAISKKAILRMYSFASNLLFEKEISINTAPNSSEKVLDLPELKENVFLSLQLVDEGLAADNFYWLSAKPEIHDYANNKWYVTPIKQYADFKSLAHIARAELHVTPATQEKDGKTIVTVELDNTTGVIAFFTQLLLKDSAGEIIYPALWCDNYVSLLPGEKRTFTCVLDKSLAGEKTTLSVSGWNVDAKQLEVN